MTSIVRILNGLSILNKAIAYFFAAIVVLVLIAILIVISHNFFYPHSELFDSIMTGPNGENLLKDIAIIGGLTQLLTISIFLNSIIFKRLAQFVEVRAVNGNLSEQIAILKPLVRIFVIAFALGTFLSTYTAFDASPESELTKWELGLELFFIWVPDFGNPVGLVMAFIIYLFAKDLDRQQQLLTESEKLKQEAELVI